MSTDELQTPSSERPRAAARGARNPRFDDSEAEYRAVPAHIRPRGEAPWRIQLCSANPSHPPIALDLYGDVALGRGGMLRGGPDVGLHEHDAEKLGVSRRHILLHPTRHHLYLIDLNSTNGTQLNGVLVGPASANPLYNNDILSLGNLHLVVRLVRTPEGAQTQRPDTSPPLEDHPPKAPAPTKTPTRPPRPRQKPRPRRPKPADTKPLPPALEEE